MRVNQISYRAMRQIAPYQTEHIEVQVELDPGESPGEALYRAVHFTRRYWNEEPLVPAEEARMRVLGFEPVKGGA